LDRNFRLFLLANIFLGVGMTIDASTFNNYLRDTFHLGVAQRTFLELPREAPGFLVMVFVGLLYALGDIRMAAVANILAAVGMVSFGLIPPVYGVMLLCVFCYSTGQHLFMPLANTIGMSFAHGGKIGSILGKIQAVQTAALVGGTVLLMLAQLVFHPSYSVTFAVGAAGFLASAACILCMDFQHTTPMRSRFVFRKEYGLFYWLSILFGARKQLFLTFGPWVLVDIFLRPVSYMTFLFLCISVIGIVVRPWVGRMTDRYGERKVLGTEALVLVGVCLTYAIAGKVLEQGLALIVVSICYVLDQTSSAVSLARATYLKKIAIDPADVSPTLGLSVSLDHIASMVIPLLGGLLWTATGRSGYVWVFVGGAVIALLNFISTRWIRVPEESVA